MRCTKLVASIAIALCLLAGPTIRQAQAQSPSWLSSAVIYCVNPEIYSLYGIRGVTAQLPRLQSLGVNTIWLMPCFPRGNAITIDGTAHPSYDSPYCINNFEAVDPSMGTAAQLSNLVTTAHGLGMKVILDLALNCTSWDNPLVQSTPQYYLHSDGNPDNVASIEEGWGTEADVAQLNLTTNEYGAQTYVTDVCEYWLQTYDLDGFRFDSADNPTGTTRSFPQSLAESIQTALQEINPNVLMLGEEENYSLALAPYGLDYGWNMWYYGVSTAFTTSGDASTLQYQWEYPYTSSYTSPAGMLHMNIQDDWDLTNRDVITLGGYPQAMAAAVFDFTAGNVPLMYNGMEVANDNGGNNPHTQIDWTGSYANQFSTFYQELLALRNNSGGALQALGTMTWVTASSDAVTCYDLTGGGQEYLVEINTNGSAVSGTISPPGSGSWIEVTPVGAPGGQSHTAPNNFSLAAYDFAIFKRSTAAQPAATPAFSLAPGTYVGTQSLTMTDATSGSTIYYTTNGTTPTTSSTKYTGAINVSSSETVEAMAVGAAEGDVRTSAYTIVSGSGGTLSGSATDVTSTTNYNLTSLGTTDWAAWGYLGSDTFDQDTSGSNQISDAGLYNGGGAGQFTNSDITLTWTNGSEDSSVSAAGTGLYNGGGVGDGFVFQAPASTTSSTLTVYLGGWESGGTLTASLSDDSAPVYTNSSMSDSSGSYYGYYTLTYKAASANQLLTVTWVQNSGSGNVTLQAATLTGGGPPTAATPTFSPAPGSYSGSQSVTISDSTSGATIYYTTNGTTPTTSSTKYTGAIDVTATETIEAIAAASGYNNSAVASGTYTITAPAAATPTFSPAAGTYGSSQSVTISDTTSGATIYYTTNGSTPTTSSTKYTAAIDVTATETVEAIAAASGYSNSAVGSATYTIETIPAAPTGLTATAGYEQAALSWTGSSGATSYNVYRGTSSGGEGATAIATGITTTSYTNTGLTDGTTYYYKVAAVDLAGTSPQSNEASATPEAGSLSGAVTTVTTAQAFNLTTLGTSDWAAWGFDGTDRDTSGGSQIGTLGVDGSGSLNSFTSSFLGFTWTNGTPDASETDETDGYYNNAGVGDGFTFTAPASTTSQTLYVFVGGWETSGTLTATLSDGSASAYTNSSLSNSGNSYYGYYTLTYHAASAGQKLTLDWTQASGSGNVTIYAAALAGPPPTATPTFSPAPGSYSSSQSVTLSDTTSGATIYYTTNGTTPTTSSTEYTGAISVTATETIEAIAAASGYSNSAVASGTYTIGSTSGTLSGAVTTVTTSQAFNLTSIGTTDWGAWGYYGTWTHDSSGGSKISNVSTYSGGSLNSFTSGFIGFTWTNGTPYSSETDETDGYYNSGVGNGFTITAPASTSVQHLTVYLGGYETAGTLTATLSDGSAGPYTNATLSSTTGSYYGYYTLTYNSASAGQTLTVVWKETSEVSGGSNLTIYAAALH